MEVELRRGACVVGLGFGDWEVAFGTFKYREKAKRRFILGGKWVFPGFQNFRTLPFYPFFFF